MELYITIPLAITILFFSYFCVIRKYIFRSSRKERSLEWFLEKTGPIFKRLSDQEYVLLALEKSDDLPHFLYNTPISSIRSKTIGNRFFYNTFFSRGLRKCEGCVYFGTNIMGPSKIIHGIDAVHGGASISFTLEQMQVFALHVEEEYENNIENACGILLEEIAIRYFKPIPLDSVQKFEIFEDEGAIVGRLLDLEDEETIFVECRGMVPSSPSSSSSILKMSNEDTLSTNYHKHYEYFEIEDNYPPEVCKDIIQKVSKHFEYEEMFVYKSDNPKKFIRRHLPQRRFMNTPGFMYVGRERDFLRNKYIFYRLYKSRPIMKDDETNTTTDDDEKNNEKTISYLFFGSDSCDESGFVHDGAICAIIDIITAWSCIMFTPPNYFCFTKNMKIKFSPKQQQSQERRRIRRYQVVRMECKYIFDAELFRGGKKRRYGIVEGSILSIKGCSNEEEEEEEEEKIYASVVANFTSIERS